MSSACRLSSLALGVAREALAADVDGARLGRAGDRADEPRVRRNPLGVGGLLGGRLEGLGEAQADPRRQLLADGAGTVARRVHEDEFGLLPDEANLDVAGRELGVQLERRLGEEVEELQPQVRAEGLAEPPRDQRRALIPELRESLKILLQPLEYDGQIHDDVTMTSEMASVKQQTDSHSASGRKPAPALNSATTSRLACSRLGSANGDRGDQPILVPRRG